jgi:hypothetical protein
MNVVECLSDLEYADRPLALSWQGNRYEIAEIVSRWRGPGEKGFHVRTVDGHFFELTYRDVTDDWHVQLLSFPSLNIQH